VCCGAHTGRGPPVSSQALYDTLVEELHTHIYNKWKDSDHGRYLLEDGVWVAPFRPCK
jgi:hypothetical protein